MGRKSNASKKEEMAHMSGGSNPSLDETKSQPENMQTESHYLLSKKRLKNRCVVIRRSDRLQNIRLPTPNQDVGPVIEEIESEEEDEPCAQVEKRSPDSIPGERSLEEKVDYLLQCLEAHEKAIDTLKSEQASKRPLQSKGPSSSEVRYKSLYFDSQKKIEALTDENCQLSKKLEVTLGKLEVCEKDTRVFSELMDKVKEVLLVSNLTKATEMALQLSSKVLGGIASPDAVVEPRTIGVKRNREKVAKKVRS
ncbi:uncharacterized protein LOC100853168 isoform X1 [Vitis vinifera]|uniref:uncharacterized protein LOC100853168 isoform X1 n=1 Tax=Vitis vinifera TaxID=29760 RepID=UPI00053FD61E|nr:uncharacterized protein LOC100853168 isoform X1 [Vitis vinifera]|eukprot:XP_010652116.1 PREDICTED: uncharacterized protein LOC100853168 isoform X1 [Vitis vinifera]